jgi:hypothetical protein
MIRKSVTAFGVFVIALMMFGGGLVFIGTTLPSELGAAASVSLVLALVSILLGSAFGLKRSGARPNPYW